VRCANYILPVVMQSQQRSGGDTPVPLVEGQGFDVLEGPLDDRQPIDTRQLRSKSLPDRVD
jgi:hypothetical protein